MAECASSRTRGCRFGHYSRPTLTLSSDMIAGAKDVESWDFVRMVPCHGDVLETNGKVRALSLRVAEIYQEAWRSAYQQFLAA